MKNKYPNFYLLLFLLVTGIVIKVTAQTNTPFNCDINAYLFQYNDVFGIDLASGTSTPTASDMVEGNINGAGYNAKDGYIWGSLKTPSNTIIKIGADYTYETHYFSELPSSSYIGDVHPNGIYYLKNGGTVFHKIDLDPSSSTYLTHLGTGTLSEDISIHDWAFNAQDDFLYTVEKGTNRLYRIDIDTGIVTNLGVVPILSGNDYTYGAVYFDLAGNFYVSSNQTGTLYIVYAVQDITAGGTISSNLFAFGPSSSSNDGARCPTAPVAMENCTNGVDDDGDGLVDCDDPSCSGVESCPVVTTTSGGNEGGLESNNRLSSLVNKRNYSRAKTGYSFDKKTAKRLYKTKNYGKKYSANFTLRDLVPLETINDTEAIESSPLDLIAITNATDIISIDYQRNKETVGVLLALKTENKVYEHTKYICDRLLGAELLSVSTIHIDEHPFIKSIIKNPKGELEFVVSFSGRMTADQTGFIIDSHWNLDTYASDHEYYNFQIWASTVDDLYTLANEVLELMKAQRTITSYNVSPPPPIFVKSTAYKNHKLTMEVVNTREETQNITVEGHKRATETSEFEPLQEKFSLDNYINQITFDTGSLYDFGFRVRNEFEFTPDDLFVSDGTWGVDDAADHTQVNIFEVTPDTTSFEEGTYAIERNVSLTATINDYVAIYRSLTPRFHAVDLSEYETMRFRAAGSGKLSITIIKDSIRDWEDQFRTEVTLKEEAQDFIIPISDFSSKLGVPIDLSDAELIVFKMTAIEKSASEVFIKIEDLQFSTSQKVVPDTIASKEVFLAPNPVEDSATFYFHMTTKETYQLYVYNVLGEKVYNEEQEGVRGLNELTFEKRNLPGGMYFYQLHFEGTSRGGKFLIKN
ncbi:T9SS type A sorting domain-containing protein [Aquimarina hainanensis]|uniref:T9SS type A sorting domain-containing protein n=1 Tax=Aquimarina hainanensis TaxID=1578017 RepID=A0ABW5NEH2_9FLAO